MSALVVGGTGIIRGAVVEALRENHEVVTARAPAPTSRSTSPPATPSPTCTHGWASWTRWFPAPAALPAAAVARAYLASVDSDLQGKVLDARDFTS